MASQVIQMDRIACPHCGQVGVLWSGQASSLPSISSGFHLEAGRLGPNDMPLIVCDHCDELMYLKSGSGRIIVAN